MTRSHVWTWTFATALHALAGIQAIRFYLRNPNG